MKWDPLGHQVQLLRRYRDELHGRSEWAIDQQIVAIERRHARGQRVQTQLQQLLGGSRRTTRVLVGALIDLGRRPGGWVQL